MISSQEPYLLLNIGHDAVLYQMPAGLASFNGPEDLLGTANSSRLLEADDASALAVGWHAEILDEGVTVVR